MFALSTWSQSVPWQFQMHIPCSKEWYKRAIPASCCEVIKKRCQHSITERQLDDSEHSVLPIDDTIANNELSFSVVDFELPGSTTLNPSMGTGLMEYAFDICRRAKTVIFILVNNLSLYTGRDYIHTCLY